MPTIGDYEDDESGYLDASLEWLSEGRLGEITRPGFLTVGQCALLIPATQHAERQTAPQALAEAVAAYVMLIQRDIAHSDLQARHPDTLLPYTEYLKMAQSGLYGDDGRDMPMPDMGWLIAFEDAEQWYASKGFAVDLVAGRADMENLSASSVQEPLREKVTAERKDAIIAGLRELGYTPGQLPKRQPGIEWVKATFWKRYGERGLFVSRRAFDKAWSELSVSGDIAETE